MRRYSLGEGVVAFSTTRHGGYSHGNHGSFNVNEYCGDDHWPWQTTAACCAASSASAKSGW